MNQRQNTSSLLQTVAAMATYRGRAPFINWQKLLGFEIGWLNNADLAALCKQYGLNPDDCEIVMMQATGLTECHMHERGATHFMALGSAHGFDDEAGGTLVGKYLGNQIHDLKPLAASGGSVFRIQNGIVHAFYANPGRTLTAVGITSPKIKQADGSFDVIPFEFVDAETRQVRPVM